VGRVTDAEVDRARDVSEFGIMVAQVGNTRLARDEATPKAASG